MKSLFFAILLLVSFTFAAPYHIEPLKINEGVEIAGNSLIVNSFPTPTSVRFTIKAAETDPVEYSPFTKSAGQSVTVYAYDPSSPFAGVGRSGRVTITVSHVYGGAVPSADFSVSFSDPLNYCSDSDESNRMVAGTVNIGTLTITQDPNDNIYTSRLTPYNSFTDSCTGFSTGIENICSGGSGVVQPAAATSGFTCDFNQECTSGRCVTLVASCTDSDGPTAFGIRGTVTNTTRNPVTGVVRTTSYTDSCVAADTVREYYCTGDNYAASVPTLCGGGRQCVDGACVAPAPTPFCDDSDGGQDRYVIGTTRTGNRDAAGVESGVTSQTDSCVPGETTKVREYYCSGSNRLSIDLTCGAGQVCNNGRCVENVCSDTDGGDVPATRGTITYGTRNPITRLAVTSTATDSCIDANTVTENYCSTESTRLTRSAACGAGFTCSDGACIAAGGAAGPFCRDSDGGNVPTVKGTTQEGSRDAVGVETITTTRQDTCVDTSHLTEYICSGTDLASRAMICDTSQTCLDGRCLNNVCSDSDGGSVVGIRGTTTYGMRDAVSGVEETSTATDSCTDSNTVTEYSCSLTNTLSTSSIDCPAGQECTDGVCATPGAVVSFCQDSDGGIVAGTRGNAKDGTRTGGTENIAHSGTDSCIDSSTVNEYYCSGNTMNSASISCGAGKECSNGECVPTGAVADVCQDSDGFNTGTKGENILGNGAFPEVNYDFCVDETKVTEYYCNGDLRESKAIACASGMKCKDGACVVNTDTVSTVRTSLMILVRGWNSFSFSVEPDTVSSTCTGFDNIQKIWTYDSAQRKYVHPSSLQSGKGYWFKAQSDCSVTATGNKVSLTNLQLKSGWNMVGSPYDPRILSNTFASCTITHGPWAYDANAQRYVPARQTEPGKGYFIKVGSDCRLR